MKISLSSLVLLLSVSTLSFASTTPPANTVVEYVAHISDVENCFKNSLLDGSNEYDFYKIDVFADQEVTFDLFSSDLIPNVIVYNHFAEPGETVGDLGRLLFSTDNSTSGSVTNAKWIPSANYWATVAISTSATQSGEYTLKVDGAAAINPMMPMPAAVPEPASAFIWAGMLGIALSLLWKRNRSR